MSLKTLFCTSSGKKQIVGLTGLGLSGFVLMHMAGNMLILVGPEAYNHYSYKLTSNPLLPVVEVVLALMFLVHIYYALTLARANQSARPVAPYQLPPRGVADRASFASRSMVYTGLLVFVFTGLHLWTFKYGTEYPFTYEGVAMRDLYRLVVEKFSNPLYVVGYLFALVVLGVHLSHGFAATFQSLGFNSVRNPVLKKVGWGFAILVSAGFISQPIYTYLHSAGAH